MGDPDQPKTSGTVLSARVEPLWLNPATIKGALAIVGGGLILLFPDASLDALRYVLGIGLILSAISDAWFHLRSPKTGSRMAVIVESVVTAGAGALLLVFPTETIRAVMVIGGLYFAVRGIVVTVAALRERRSDRWGLDLARGAFFVVFAVMVIALPEAVEAGVIVTAAVGAIGVGAIMLSFGVQPHSPDVMVDLDAASVSQIVRDWAMRQDIGDVHRDEIDSGLFFEQPDRTNKLAAFWVMLLLSVTIATLGILQNSTAVVIGAMLIAPLMTPIIGAAAAAVNGWQTRIMASMGLVVAGVAASIGLAFVIGAWAPQLVPLTTNPQVVSRVNPNLIDMGIAIAAGAAGAFANVNKRVSASIAGVAIAVALVPPLGVVGLTLHAGMFEDAFGAFMLFMTNLVSIILAAMIVFGLTGFAPISSMRHNAIEIKRVAFTVAVAAMLIAIPLAFTVSSVLSTATRQNEAQKAVESWLENTPELALNSIDVKGTDVSIVITGSQSFPAVSELEEALAAGFDDPVTVTVEHIPSIVVIYSDADGEVRTEIKNDQ
jgi:uncharacterized hydrophobic protein (TIGR00271 family)